MSSKIDKETLKGPDAFHSFSERVFKKAEEHARLIALGVVVIVVGALGWLGYDYYAAHQENKAAEALYPAEAEIKKVETKLREEGAKTPGQPPPKADFQADYAAGVDKLKTEIKKFDGTKAAMISALNLVYLLVQQKQYEQALEVIDIPKYRPGGGDILLGFWNMHRGLIYLENQKTEDAIKSYEAVLSAKSLKSFHPEALIKVGVAYEAKGNGQKARESYERVSREFPDTEASSTAKQYLRLMDLKPAQG